MRWSPPPALPLRAWPGRVRAAVVCLVVLAGAGCAKKMTAVDPSFTVPEGQVSSSSILEVHRNLGNLAFFFREFQPFSETNPQGPSPGDTLVSDSLAVGDIEGVVQGLVFDSTAASNYEIFKRDANGGLAPLFDYRLPPKQRWLDTQWEKYFFVDQRIEPTASYQARGVVAGAVSLGSPLSNTASDPFAHFSDIYDIPITFPDPRNDSVLVISWPAVPGAAGYFVDVYKFRFDYNRAHDPKVDIATGAPAPVYDGAVTDVYLAYLSDQTQCSLGAGDHTLTDRGINRSDDNVVRVSAIDCAGRLIGFSAGEIHTVFLQSNPDRLNYYVYFKGGYAFPRPRPPSGAVIAQRVRVAPRLRAAPEFGRQIIYRIR